MNIHSPSDLWKTPVDKLVDSVENSELSTAILLSAVSVFLRPATAYRNAYFMKSQQNPVTVLPRFGIMSLMKKSRKVRPVEIFAVKCSLLFLLGKKYLLKTAKKEPRIIWHRLEILYL